MQEAIVDVSSAPSSTLQVNTAKASLSTTYIPIVNTVKTYTLMYFAQLETTQVLTRPSEHLDSLMVECHVVRTTQQHP